MSIVEMDRGLTEFDKPRGLTGWKVEPIATATATEMVVEHHYLHRKGPCSAAFGLIDPAGGLQGVVTYGTPASAALRRGIAGPDRAGDVIELTRLWVDDSAPRFGESFLIGRTVRKAGKPIVVSFADSGEGHIGTVYQATNWLYTGLSAKRTDWMVKGLDLHGHTLTDRYTAAEIRAKYGDRFSLVPRSRKHRYVFIVPRGRERRRIIADLRYPILPYPKAVHPNE